jgi:membrane-bound metal-dependent hydrolase YbcI (DUF457 family)
MTPISHAAVGLVGWKYFSRPKNGRALVFFIIVSCALDLDFLFYYLFGRPRIFVHQLYSHTIIVALAVALVFFPFFKTAKERWGLIIVGQSHLVMDLFVIDPVPPIGIRPFYPVSGVFFNYGFFPYVDRGGWAAIFSLRNALALGLEVALFVVPALIICRKELVGLRRALRR